MMFMGCHIGYAEMLLKVRAPTNHMVPYRIRRNADKGAHQGEGPTCERKNAKERTPFPTNHRGSCLQRRNAINPFPPPNLGREEVAEMPVSIRPNNNDQRPPPLRRNAIAIAPRN
jgi:hypothetical protein